jgi:hypothetical protein
VGWFRLQGHVFVACTQISQPPRPPATSKDPPAHVDVRPQMQQQHDRRLLAALAAAAARLDAAALDLLQLADQVLVDGVSRDTEDGAAVDAAVAQPTRRRRRVCRRGGGGLAARWRRWAHAILLLEPTDDALRGVVRDAVEGSETGYDYLDAVHAAVPRRLEAPGRKGRWVWDARQAALRDAGPKRRPTSSVSPASPRLPTPGRGCTPGLLKVLY